METIATTQPITKEVVTGTMNIALTRASVGIQTLSDLESKLVYNEDNLQSISAFLDKARQARKIVENEHQAIKEPILRQSQIIDESKRNMIGQIDAVMKIATEKYTSMCREIEDRKRKVELENQRKQQILSGIDSNMISFSGKIAECKTDRELIQVERLINLEKTYKKKYQEYFDTAVEKYSSLTALCSMQRKSIQEFDELEKKRLAAEKKGDDETLISIQQQQFSLESKIDEAKVTIQETAINQSISTNFTEAREIIQDVKTRHRTWAWEIQDIQKTVKYMPTWTKVETVNEKIVEFMRASKGSWAEQGKEEVVINGIRFYLKKTY